MTGFRRVVAAVALLAGSAAAPLSAQSLFATRGLGVPVYPVDARAAALGGVGVGLLGFHTSMVNPAELAGITRRGVSAAIQPLNTSVDVGGVSDGTSGTRFPLLNVLYPVSPRLVVALGYGGYLDQTWGVLSQSVQIIDGEAVTVNDLLESTGGISQIRLSGSWSFSSTLSVGGAVGLFAGNVDRTATRSFADSAGAIEPFVDEMRWSFSAPMAAVGVRWDAANGVRIGASAMVGGELDADSDDDGAEDRSYGAPIELTAGASMRINPLLMATAGGTWSQAPSTDGIVERSPAFRAGAGLEYQGIRSGLRTYPVRVGARWAQLPYHLNGESRPTEWGISGGIGFRLGDPMDPAAVADLAVERGARGGLAGSAESGGVDEQLWRVTFSLSLFAR